MTSNKQTISTINGLRLVSPEEAGYESRDKSNRVVESVVFRENKPDFYIHPNGTWVLSDLIPLPKPRTTRPYRRGEVKCGDVFRHKEDGSDRIVTRVHDLGVELNSLSWLYEPLLQNFQKLTYDSEGREVLSEAGQVDES